MRKVWLLAVTLIAQSASVCFCAAELAAPPEKFSVEKLLISVEQVDTLFTGKHGDEIFSVNASKRFKLTVVKPLMDALLAAIDAVDEPRLSADFAALKVDGVIANWLKAVDAGWLEAEPDVITEVQRKAIGNIMTIYSGNANRVLEHKVSRIIENDYFRLLAINKKVKECLLFFLGAQ